MIIFFMLPGMVLGGSWISAFFHIAGNGLEPLKALAWAGVVWSVSAFLAVKLAGTLHAGRNTYYYAAVFAAVALTLGPGICRSAGGAGVVEGWTGIVLTALFSGTIFYALLSDSCCKSERWSLVAGVLLAGVIWCWAALRMRLAWMETLFFYLGEILLLCWLLASPLTRRGAESARWLWRGCLLALVIAAYYAAPVFSYPYRGRAPENFPDGLWCKSRITPQTAYFTLMERSGSSAFTSPDGRVIMYQEDDEYLTASLPGLLSVLPTARPDIQLIASYRSCLPQNLRAITGKYPRCHRLPDSWTITGNMVKNKRIGFIFDRNPIVSRQDLLLIAALPENPYPAAIRRFVKYFMRGLNPNGVVALPAHLLQNPELFTLLHEKFTYANTLDAPGHLWIFSNRKLDIRDHVIEKNLNDLYGENSPVPPGMYSTLTRAQIAHERDLHIVPPENFQWGSNRWLGQWWWILSAVAIVLLWRIFRLFGERRNIMYTYFNTVENGFGAMGIFLLSLSLIMLYTGAFNLVIAAAALTAVAVWTRFSAGGAWGAIMGALLVPLAVAGSNLYCFWLLPVMVQAMGSAGWLPFAAKSSDIQERRKLLEALHIGFMMAAMAMLAVWWFNVPLLFIWAIFTASRIPGIWQYK